MQAVRVRVSKSKNRKPIKVVGNPIHTVRVRVSKEYNVKIGANLLTTLGQEAAALIKGRRAALVSDSNVWPLYGEVAETSLKDAGFTVSSFVFPHGEASKNGETYLRLLEFLAENQITRTDCLIALGGGVVGDMTGFAAATYLRGVSYIQVPTTLLAMVDSSVGGKTAIDLPAGKNLAGAFCQPVVVLCDIQTLDTLPEEIFRDGCAEVIKYGVLYDEELIAELYHKGIAFDRQKVIAQCVAHKRNVVEADEFDTGDRQYLNLGHTVGHAIEKASNYSVSHGRAVAIGICIVARSVVKDKIANGFDCEWIVETIKRVGLPTTTDIPPEILAQNALSDKKRQDDFIRVIAPDHVGECWPHSVFVDQLPDFIKRGI